MLEGSARPPTNRDPRTDSRRARLRVWQAIQAGEALGCRRGISCVPSHPKETFEHAPTLRQRRVDVHTAEKGLDRAWRIPQRRIAIPALLVEKAEPRMQLLQAPQRVKRLVNAVQATLIDGDQVQKVAVLRRCKREGFGRDQR